MLPLGLFCLRGWQGWFTVYCLTWWLYPEQVDNNAIFITTVLTEPLVWQRSQSSTAYLKPANSVNWGPSKARIQIVRTNKCSICGKKLITILKIINCSLCFQIVKMFPLRLYKIFVKFPDLPIWQLFYRFPRQKFYISWKECMSGIKKTNGNHC